MLRLVSDILSGDLVQYEFSLYGICGGQSGSGTGFLRIFVFLLSVFISPNATFLCSVTRGWHSSPLTAEVPRDCVPSRKKGSNNIHNNKKCTISHPLVPMQ
jgi:hypothetical protein